MRLRKILRGRGGLVACLGLAFVLGAATVGAVQTAGASGGIGTTYHACLLRGDLSKLGTATPKCPTGSTVISWSSIGAEGVREPKAPGGRASSPDSCLATPYPGIDLADCSFIGANMTGDNLTGADLAGANLLAVDIARANLTGANLIGARLTDDKTLANLTGANLTGANLTGTALTGANLT